MLLEEVEEKGEAHKLLETIKRRGDEANKVVINLLNFARREVGKHEKKKLKIEAIIVNALEMVDQELNAYNIEKKIKMPKEDIEIFGDEFELKEAFLNLMKNSIEAMPNGGQLSIDVALRNKMIVICISDNGVGMNEETLEKLFIPFYTTKVDSVGFGLFETQRIIQKHEGKIKVNSKLGEGSTFIIEFPLLLTGKG
jgi:signal transduction histidine kinase